jgi:hypothetical protein
VRGHVLALAAALALALAIPAAAQRHAVAHYKVVAARASATLAFHTQNADASEISDGTITLAASNSGTGKATVPGRALVGLKGSVKERVTTQRTPSDSSPYQETCSKSNKVGGKGGFTLRRSGSKIQATWAFPQAKASFCRGPSASRAIISKMKRLYSASALGRSRMTLVVSGSGKSQTGTTRVTYRWRATVTLTRT